MKTLAVVLIAAGAVLIYSAIKNKDPRTVIQEALAGKTGVVGNVPGSATGGTGGTGAKEPQQSLNSASGYRQPYFPPGTQTVSV